MLTHSHYKNSYGSTVYASGSQPVCRDTQVCRGIFSSVPPSPKITYDKPKNSTIFAFIDAKMCRQTYLTEQVCRGFKKVEKHSSTPTQEKNFQIKIGLLLLLKLLKSSISF
jgi:hypothetical protein